MRKYQFRGELIGDVNLGRPNLGVQIDVEIYRLMQFTLRDILEERYGSDAADEVFRGAGRLAGNEFYKNLVHPAETLDEFISKVQSALIEKKIGVLRIEEVDVNVSRIILTVDEDLDCSGLPELDYEACLYDEGFISALFDCFTKEKWTAKEIDCWCTGSRTCRFIVTKNWI
ncbi:MAG: 4-vinyl reductase [Syntrophobacterales bacterium]|jgi:predicted hydrocarbon binding protein|nr:4-vinyl reductase [Syntrophobacterales bacterium]